MFLLLVLLFVVAASLILLEKKHAYWAKKGIAHVTPWFILGNVQKIVFQRKRISDVVENAYYEFKRKNKQHGGIYFFYTPIWIPVDRKLIKQILTKDFNYFNSHGIFHHENDPISVNLISLGGSKWKTLRSKLTPTFSPGNLKLMFDSLYELSGRIEAKVQQLSSLGNPIEMKENAACFGTDVMVTCFLGLECNTVEDRNNNFRKYSKVMFEPRPLRMLLEFVVNWDFLGSMGYTFNPKKVNEFFYSITKETVEYREKNNISRRDYLDLLLQLKNKGALDNKSEDGTSGFITFDEVVANIFILNAAGYETSSTAIAFLMYELAKNQDIQEKVRQEILDVCENRPDNRITYEDLGEMKYCDMCISETLRRYTPLPEVPRQCTETYLVPETNEVIDKGTTVFIPAWVLHNDPEYFPDPLTFNPENFSQENVKKRPDFCFIPFGEGPRLCIGMRFALMVIKISLVRYLRNYRYTLNEKTPSKVTFKADSITLNTKEELLLNVEKIA